MASFVIRDIDDALWKQAKSKAALEGVTLKELLPALIAQWVKTVTATAKKR